MTKKEYIIQNFEDHLTEDISKAINTSRFYVCYIAKKHHLVKNPEIREQERRIKNERISKSRRSILRMEEIRMLSGQQQTTRIKFRQHPKHEYYARFRLKTRYGYILPPEDFFVLLYDDKTERTPKEEYFVKRYGFKFIRKDQYYESIR